MIQLLGSTRVKRNAMDTPNSLESPRRDAWIAVAHEQLTIINRLFNMHVVRHNYIVRHNI